jgi:hypothetical protein
MVAINLRPARACGQVGKHLSEGARGAGRLTAIAGRLLANPIIVASAAMV